MRIIFASIIILSSILGNKCFANNNTVDNIFKNDYILYINTYDKTNDRSISVYENFCLEFKKSYNIKIHVEHLSLDYNRNLDYFNNYAKIIFRKYPNKPKVVILYGDGAWVFYHNYIINQWKDVPIVFSTEKVFTVSLEDFISDKEICNKEQESLITSFGKANIVPISTPVPILKTILLMKDLIPDMKGLVLISDERYVCRTSRNVVKKVVNRAFPEFKFIGFEAIDMETDQMLDSLSKLDKNFGILFFSWYKGDSATKSAISSKAVNEMITSFANSPVFSIIDNGVKEGRIAGGVFSSNEDLANIMCINTIDKIKNPIKDTTKKIRFKRVENVRKQLNYVALTKSGISSKNFPKDATYYDFPQGVFEKNKTTILVLSIVILCILILTIVALHIEKHFLKLREADLIISKERAERSDLLKSQFISNMSHEIRTPLNAIVGFSNILASNEEISDNEKKEYFEYIKTNNNLLLQIINDILDISMIEAETIDFNNTKSDINDVLKSIEVSFKLKLKDNGSKLNVIFETKCPECILFIDRNRLLQVINNLINNAIKFTDEGDIKFGYTKENDQITNSPVLRFFVTDTGIGIPEDKIDSVFDRFIKLCPEKVGSGLGLSIAKSIVNHYNGQIGVISEVGKGSTFWFTIPCM